MAYIFNNTCPLIIKIMLGAVLACISLHGGTWLSLQCKDAVRAQKMSYAAASVSPPSPKNTHCNNALLKEHYPAPAFFPQPPPISQRRNNKKNINKNSLLLAPPLTSFFFFLSYKPMPVPLYIKGAVRGYVY